MGDMGDGRREVKVTWRTTAFFLAAFFCGLSIGVDTFLPWSRGASTPEKIFSLRL